MTVSPLLLPTIVLLAALLEHSNGALPSLGMSTAAAVRSELPDAAFAIDLNNGTRVVVGSTSFKVASLDRFPALGAIDVQFAIAKVRVRGGKLAFSHVHPRATEVGYVTRGRLQVTFNFESNARTVSNVIKPGESFIIPQGLLHFGKCLSKRDCEFILHFNSADPGTVLV